MSERPSAARSEAEARLVSSLANDPEVTELIQFFLDELSRRVAELQAALHAGQLEQLRLIVHQLKGAAGGYGFEAISDCAAAAESALLAEEAELSAASERIEDLILLCQRAAAAGETPP